MYDLDLSFMTYAATREFVCSRGFCNSIDNVVVQVSFNGVTFKWLGSMFGIQMHGWFAIC